MELIHGKLAAKFGLKESMVCSQIRIEERRGDFGEKKAVECLLPAVCVCCPRVCVCVCVCVCV